MSSPEADEERTAKHPPHPISIFVGMKAARKVLYIKNRSEGKFARSWVVEPLGTHGRIIGDPALLEKVLEAETFDLVVLDQRGGNAELIPSIEAIHAVQPQTKMVVVGENIGLADVRQAMRYGVHDMFPPPFELFSIVERVDALMAQMTNTRPTAPEVMYFRWSELAATLNGQLDEVFAQVDSGPPPAAPAPDPAAPSIAELNELCTRQTAELEALRTQLSEASESRARLNDQIAQLSAGASAMGRMEARARSLEAELEELRRTGAGGVDIGSLRDDLDRAQARIAELERLNNGLLAGSGDASANGSDTSELEERIRALEAELADVNARFEAAGQAFATEMEQIMGREAEAMAALAAAEERERKAQAVMASAGDAFGRADESIERERSALQEQRAEVDARAAEIADQEARLRERESALRVRMKEMDTIGQGIAADVEGTIASLGALAEQTQNLLRRREELRTITGS